MPDKNTIWSLDAYVVHNEAMRRADDKFRNERDRRYTEVNDERAKALKIKEVADEVALKLARESQTYKDERNDAMREQSLSQTGIFATHADLNLLSEETRKSIDTLAERTEKAFKPVIEYINSQQGVVQGGSITKGNMYAMITAITAIIVAAIYLMK